MKQVAQSFRTGRLRVLDVPPPLAAAGRLLVETRKSLISAGTEKQLRDLARATLVGKAVARPDLVRRVVRSVRRDGVGPAIQKAMARLEMPQPLGYSLAGRVVEIGSGVTGFAVGDRIACAGAGYANHAELNAIPKNLVVPIPAEVDDEAASFVALGAIALQGVRLAMPTLGERIVVIGLGLVGLLTVQLLKASGCQVLGFDPDAVRAELARTQGADVATADDLLAAAASFTRGLGADAVIVTASTASSAPVNSAAEISRQKGRIIVVGSVGMSIDREAFYRRELELKVSTSYGPGRYDPAYEIDGHDYPLPYVRWSAQRNMEAFLGLVRDGKVTPKALITHRFDIANAHGAYELMERGEPHLAILLGGADAGAASTTASRLPVSAAAGETCGVAFVGFGAHARSVLLPAVTAVRGTTLTTVVTATGLSAADAAGRCGFASASTSPAAAMSDPASEVIVIATRHDTHAALAAQALRAGKHVFCEKPLALDDTSLEHVVAAARASGGLLISGFNRRFAPLLRKARSHLEPRSGPVMMLYRVNAGAVPSDSWIQREEGGGRILGEVCHFIDTLTFLTGSLPVEVHAIAAQGHADTVSLLIRFADGSTGTIVYSSLGDDAVAKEYLEVFAAGRVVQLDDFRRLDITANGRTRRIKSRQDKGHRAIMAEFLDAVRSGREPPIPLDDMIAVTQATFAAAMSLRVGAPVRLAG